MNIPADMVRGHNICLFGEEGSYRNVSNQGRSYALPNPLPQTGKVKYILISIWGTGIRWRIALD